MKSYIVRSIAVVTILAAVVISTGCALFKPTPACGCPQITQPIASGLAYGGTLAAIKKGAPKSVMSGIASNIDASIVTGQFDGTLIDVSIAKAGGQTWAQAFGAVEIMFGTAW